MARVPLAHGAVRAPQTGCGDVGDGAICSVVVHTRLFDGAKVVFFCSNSERNEGVCILADTLVFVGGSARRCALPTQRSLARRRFRSTLRVADTAFTGEKEVPLDAARLAEWCTAQGAKEGKDGRRNPLLDRAQSV